MQIQFEGCWFGVSTYVFIVCGKVLEKSILYWQKKKERTCAIALVLIVVFFWI
jgi:hypothetical protein